MTTSTEPVARPVLRCPSCGNRGERGVLRFLTDVTSWAEVLGECAGVLELAGPLQPTMQDEPSRPRLECWALRPAPDNRVCGHRWQLPAEIRGLIWRIRS